MTPPDTGKSRVAEHFLRKEFLELLAARLEAGARDYGNASFERPGTAAELLDEVLDVAGWSYVLWVQLRQRLQGIEIAAKALELPADGPVE